MKIAVAGFGVEGQSNLAYFRQKFPLAEFVIVDENLVNYASGDIEIRSGKNVFSEQLGDIDLVLRAPSIAPSRLKTNGKIWSATNEFFAECPAPIIGVTGTKGKGTTCSLIASILRAAGKTVYLVGNIGTPALDVLPQVKPDDVVVYELSSFQLWDLEKSPNIAVITIIELDHLDVHADFDEYVKAKQQIVAHQNSEDTVIFCEANMLSQKIAEVSPGHKIPYENNLTLAEIKALKLPGGHNRDNATAAILAARAALPEILESAVCEGLAGFTGLPHRLKFVAEKRDVQYYDDSIATTPGSAIAAIKSFTQPKILILGGYDKGADYQELAQEVSQSNMRLVILIGQNAKKIQKCLMQHAPQVKVINLGETTMPQVVATARTHAQPGDVVILSPAAASFGMFKSYTDRGEQFVKAVG